MTKKVAQLERTSQLYEPLRARQDESDRIVDELKLDVRRENSGKSTYLQAEASSTSFSLSIQREHAMLLYRNDLSFCETMLVIELQILVKDFEIRFDV